ncbi:hypothetical protein BH20ACT22_BH20ACT22_04800 [soil metagenome]
MVSKVGRNFGATSVHSRLAPRDRLPAPNYRMSFRQPVARSNRDQSEET